MDPHRLGRGLPVRGPGVIPRSLAARLTLALMLVLGLMGTGYAFVALQMADRYLDSINRVVNRDLARNIVAERRLVQEGGVDRAAVERAFHEYMAVNPAIELYLLDPRGRILSYSAEPGTVKQDAVDMEAVRAALAGRAVLGDDPRHPGERKTFSVTWVPDAVRREGLLYVVLRGQAYAQTNEMLRTDYFHRVIWLTLALALVAGAGLGTLLMVRLTRRVRRLAAEMAAFEAGGFRRVPVAGPEGAPEGDELEQLTRRFHRLAQHAAAQFARLRRMDQGRRETIAAVSHDLRTPLAAMQGYLETLDLRADRLPAQERRRYVQAALRQGRRLHRLIEALFEMAKLDAPGFQPRREVFPVAELAFDLVQRYRHLGDQRRLRVSVDCEPGLPPVWADIGLVERALANLLDNALAHTGPGGEVVLALRGIPGAVELEVRDNGCGVEPADLERIFRPFEQVGNRHRGGGCSGLGLAIVRRIVEVHGGRIRAESAPGRGMRILLVLPAAGGRGDGGTAGAAGQAAGGSAGTPSLSRTSG